MSEKLFQKYKVEIELLSPLFIGSGKEWYPNEYYWDKEKENFLYLANFEKLREKCREKNIDLLHSLKEKRFFEKISSPSAKGEVKSFILTKFIKENRIPLNEITEKAFEVKRDLKKSVESFPSIREFIKDGNGNYFIPGSSLKGCFRTLYLWKEVSFLSEEEKSELIKFNERKIKFRKKASDEFQNKIEKKYNSLFQKIRFSDFYFSDFEVNITQVFRGKIPQFIEVVEKGKATGEIWTEKFPQEIEEIKLKRFREISIELLKTLNKSRNVGVKNQMETKDQIKIIEEVSSLKGNEMIIRLGFGKGFDFTTVGNWIKEGLGFRGLRLWFPNIKQRLNTIFDFPLTYWKVYDKTPFLGWVKLTFEKI